MIAIFSICNVSFHGLRPLARYFSQGFMKKYLSLRLKSSTTFDWRLWTWTLHLQLRRRSIDLAVSSCSWSSITLEFRKKRKFTCFFILSEIKAPKKCHRKQASHSSHSDVYQTGSSVCVCYTWTSYSSFNSFGISKWQMRVNTKKAALLPSALFLLKQIVN